MTRTEYTSTLLELFHIANLSDADPSKKHIETWLDINASAEICQTLTHALRAIGYVGEYTLPVTKDDFKFA
jgi:hypothetical protein